MRFDKRVWGTLLVIAAIVSGTVFVYGIFETKEAHKTDVDNVKESQKKDTDNLKETVRLEMKVLAAEMGVKQAEVLLPALKKMILEEHRNHSSLSNDSSDVMADGRARE